jgi:tetratricopeptide (TPR) repeat protein
VSSGVFEQYRDALRRGHAALASGDLESALAGYREAGDLARDRPAPHIGIGQALLAQDDPQGALAAFGAALALAPRDETALRGRAESLARLRHATDAAEAFDVLADVELASGRLADALATTLRALDLAEQKARRRRLADLTRRLRPADPEGAPDESDAAGIAPEADEEPPTAIMAAAEGYLDAGDLDAARGAFLAAAAAFERDGLYAAALDSCYVALSFAPADADVHLQFVELYVALGWRTPAADKLALLGRLVGLEDASRSVRARIVGMAADHFPDDPRLRGMSARAG